MISNSPRSVNPLPRPVTDQIVNSVRSASKASGAAYVAFDADGTLWLEDAGELFFEELIESQLVELPADPLGHYQSLKAQHPPTAYTWLAQILEGHALTEVKRWALRCYEKRTLTVFEDIRGLLQHFHDQKIEVWVVTASVQWAVEMAVEFHGLPVTGVLGVTTEVDQGVVTHKGVTPVTWREGKAKALLAAKSGVRPLFCAGNTTGDLALMEISQTAPLALHSQKAEGPLKRSELELQTEAKRQGWLIHTF